MSRLARILLGCHSFSVLVEQSAPELIVRLQAAIGSGQAARPSEATHYIGEFSESGFILQRVAEHSKDLRAAVVARGELESTAGSTWVHVTVRHGRRFIFFGWLLALLATFDAVATTQLAGSRNLTTAAVLAGFAILWFVLLWRNIRQIGNQIRALLMTDQPGWPTG